MLRLESFSSEMEVNPGYGDKLPRHQGKLCLFGTDRGVIAQHLEMLTYVGDRMYETAITVEALMIIRPWQWLHRHDPAYSERLLQPLSMYLGHPLARYIGKQAHGVSMSLRLAFDTNTPPNSLKQMDATSWDLAFQTWSGKSEQG